jgi:hypothetical protein
MAHTERHGHEPAQAGYETTDANLGGTERLYTVVAIFLAAVFALVWFMFGQMKSREAARDQPLPRLAADERAKDPRRDVGRFPSPRLQTTPYVDLKAFRAAEDAVLQGYSWVDRNAGVAQIPVDRAIDLIVEKGMPTPPPAPPVPLATPGTAPLTAPPGTGQ